MIWLSQIVYLEEILLEHLRITKKKVLKYLLIVSAVVLFFVIFYTPILKMPISWAGSWVGIEAEPGYIPIEYSKSYMTTSSCGKRCDKLKLH